MASRWSKYAALVALVAFSTTSVLADAPAAFLETSGAVTLNGKAVKHTASVFMGDRIQTDAGAAGTLLQDGTSILLLEQSKIRFESGAIEVERGGVSIKTSRQMGARLLDVAVTPGSSVARYRAYTSGLNVTIAAIDGALDIGQAGMLQHLNAGQSVTLRCKSCKMLDTVDPQTGPTDSNSNNIGLIVGLTATIGSAIAAAIIVGQTKASPSGP
jgi:hypothetical protein